MKVIGSNPIHRLFAKTMETKDKLQLRIKLGFLNYNSIFYKYKFSKAMYSWYLDDHNQKYHLYAPMFMLQSGSRDLIINQSNLNNIHGINKISPQQLKNVSYIEIDNDGVQYFINHDFVVTKTQFLI